MKSIVIIINFLIFTQIQQLIICKSFRIILLFMDNH